MKSKKVLRYYCEGCGRGFWKKKTAANHEKNCWHMPKNKTCISCKHGEYVEDGCDHPEIPGCPSEVWSYYDCHNENNKSDEHKGAPKDVDYLSVNCEYWDIKKES